MPKTKARQRICPVIIEAETTHTDVKGFTSGKAKEVNYGSTTQFNSNEFQQNARSDHKITGQIH